jgi:intergrase/recombinase
MVVSGLRFEETINSYNLIIGLSRENELNKHYDREKQTLEHYRFKNVFIRRTKKAFISFIPEAFIERISKREKLTRAMIDNRVKRGGFKSRFSDIREYFATSMTSHLSSAEIDFLQGRVSGSVFMRNYFNPALIVDLKESVQSNS